MLSTLRCPPTIFFTKSKRKEKPRYFPYPVNLCFYKSVESAKKNIPNVLSSRHYGNINLWPTSDTADSGPNRFAAGKKKLFENTPARMKLF